MKMLEYNSPEGKTNPTNPFRVAVSEQQSTDVVQSDTTMLETNRDTDLEKVNRLGEQTKKDPDPYLITRAGLGKLLYIQLCDGDSIVKQYFSVISMGFGRLIDAWRNIWKEGFLVNLVAMVYGGAHLATWNNKFPTKVESWLWKGSAIITAVSVGFFVLALSLGSILKKFGQGGRFFRWFCGVGLGLGLVPVLFARVFIFIECFITLRKIPENSYQTVAWAETWPKFG